MTKHDYQKLKDNKGFVVIKADEVLLPIFVKGLLNRRETQLVWYVILDSWRWKNRQYSQRPVNLRQLSKATGIGYPDVTRIWKSLRKCEIIRVDAQGKASFNEHYDEWKPCSEMTVKTTAESKPLSKRQPKVVKTTVKTVKTTTPTPHNGLGDNELRKPKNNIKNNLKINNTSPGVSRRESYENNALKLAISEKFGIVEKPAKIQLALNECQAADLHPLDLINQATRDWFGYLHAACRSPDDYGDRTRSFHVFVDQVCPKDPKLESMLRGVNSPMD